MKEKPGANIRLVLQKSTKKTARFNVPIRRTNRSQQLAFICLHTTARAGFGIRLRYILEHNKAIKATAFSINVALLPILELRISN